MAEKRETIKDICVKIAPKVWQKHPIAKPKDFIEAIATQNIEQDEICINLSENEKKDRINREMKIIESSVRKALYRLNIAKKIGTIGKAKYISIEDENINTAKEYLKKNIKPLRSELQKVNSCTYVLPIMFEDVTKVLNFSNNEKYDGQIDKIEKDLSKVIEYIKETEERKTDKIKKSKLISKYIRMLLDIEKCYDAIYLEDRIIILFYDEVKNMEKFDEFQAFIKELYDAIYNPPQVRIKLKK